VVDRRWSKQLWRLMPRLWQAERLYRSHCWQRFSARKAIGMEVVDQRIPGSRADHGYLEDDLTGAERRCPY
jgi:hypothetical protein